MKLPVDLLASLRGPLLGVAIAGCATAPAAAPITEEPAPEPAGVAVASEVMDPVGYDAEAEAARLARADDARIDHDSRRDRRIAELEADRRRARQTTRISPIQTTGWSIDHMRAACGRG